ncbi:hypothetical protein ACEPAF_5549 [Sanghuangporus sanghuang]
MLANASARDTERSRNKSSRIPFRVLLLSGEDEEEGKEGWPRRKASREIATPIAYRSVSHPLLDEYPALQDVAWVEHLFSTNKALLSM